MAPSLGKQGRYPFQMASISNRTRRPYLDDFSPTWQISSRLGVQINLEHVLKVVGVREGPPVRDVGPRLGDGRVQRTVQDAAANQSQVRPRHPHQSYLSAI